MKKFYALVIKELRELLTWQMILPLIITVIMFAGLGKVIGSQSTKLQSTRAVTILDQDNTELTKSLIEALKASDITVKTGDGLVIDEAMRKNNTVVGFVLPKNFSSNIEQFSSPTIETYTNLKNFSFTGSKSTEVLRQSTTIINEVVSTQLLIKSISPQDIAVVKMPVKTVDHVTIGKKTALVAPEQVMSFVATQTTFIPIILFIVIIFAAQMIATAIATEKENKTLETLLSMPVSRQAIVASKMMGAGIVALATALVYMGGMKFYIGGLLSSVGGSSGGASKEAISALGLNLSFGDYGLIGLSLFVGILVALAIALILGAFAEDSKSVQGLITPLMVLMIIPYYLVLFLDLNDLPQLARTAIYAIPFSHPFLSAPNIFLENYSQVYYGIAYQVVVFVIFLFIASKIFASSKILTMKLNFSKKK